jgi:hypothetical protein
VNGQWAYVILDGVITHCSHDLILWCRDHFVGLILRPPNTSSCLQPEDVVIFKKLKSAWVDYKNAILYKRIINLGEADLSWEDVTVRGKLAWEAAMTKHLIKRAWRAVGVFPFTRRVEVRLRRKEAKAAARAAKSKVKVMTLNQALAVMNKPSVPNLPERRDDGRAKGGRLDFGRALTSVEAVAKGSAEAAVKKAAQDLAESKRTDKAESFASRGEATAEKLTTNNGRIDRLTVAELKDLLRFKGCPASELTKAKRPDLVDIFTRRFSLTNPPPLSFERQRRRASRPC